MGARVEEQSTGRLASGGCHEVTFTSEPKVDLFSMVIGLVVVIFYSFSAVISFWVSEATRCMFFIQFVLFQGHSDGVRCRTVHGRLSILGSSHLQCLENNLFFLKIQVKCLRGPKELIVSLPQPVSKTELSTLEAGGKAKTCFRRCNKLLPVEMYVCTFSPSWMVYWKARWVEYINAYSGWFFFAVHILFLQA